MVPQEVGQHEKERALEDTFASDVSPWPGGTFNHVDGVAISHRHTRSTPQSHHSSPVQWDLNGSLTPSRSAQQANANLGPRFWNEPPSLVEYSNSTGAVINCRPQLLASAEQTSAMASDSTNNNSNHSSALNQKANSRAKLIGATPTLVTWRQVERMGQSEEAELQTGANLESWDSPVSGNEWRFVRQDGSLVIKPFDGRDFRQEIHSATYRCCLSNKFGSLCSRPIRSRAGKSCDIGNELGIQSVLNFVLNFRQSKVLGFQFQLRFHRHQIRKKVDLSV